MNGSKAVANLNLCVALGRTVLLENCWASQGFPAWENSGGLSFFWANIRLNRGIIENSMSWRVLFYSGNAGEEPPKRDVLPVLYSCLADNGSFSANASNRCDSLSFCWRTRGPSSFKQKWQLFPPLKLVMCGSYCSTVFSTCQGWELPLYW